MLKFDFGSSEVYPLCWTNTPQQQSPVSVQVLMEEYFYLDYGITEVNVEFQFYMFISVLILYILVHVPAAKKLRFEKQLKM